MKDFPRDQWPDNIPLLYYSYHIMVGLGTMLILLMLHVRVVPCGARVFTTTGALLWALMLALPFPYIATTAGWMTAELGRQPWLIYGLMRTADGVSLARFGRQRIVHADGFHGAVPAVLESCSCFWCIARSITGPASGRGRC